MVIRFWHDQIPNDKYVLPTNSEFVLERRKFGGVDYSVKLETGAFETAYKMVSDGNVLEMSFA